MAATCLFAFQREYHPAFAGRCSMPTAVTILGRIPVVASIGEQKSPTLYRHSGITYTSRAIGIARQSMRFSLLIPRLIQLHLKPARHLEKRRQPVPVVFNLMR